MNEQLVSTEWMRASVRLFEAANRVLVERGAEHLACGCDDISDCDIACLRKAAELYAAVWHETTWTDRAST